ncbi:MAG: TrkA family potassium uptake protein [Dehalococcoidia bacterium]|nr:TrkA family potassium uptake protein [Dehalococcoidia bacterium]
MKILIMGCGRLGARLAGTLDAQGHDVTVLDINQSAFRRLPEGFRGRRAVGNGMDGPALERAGIQDVEAFFAVTQGDNRNYFASQLAREVYGVKRVLCRIYDPVREQIFREMGLETFSPTSIGAQIMADMLLKGGPAAAGR